MMSACTSLRKSARRCPTSKHRSMKSWPRSVLREKPVSPTANANFSRKPAAGSRNGDGSRAASRPNAHLKGPRLNSIQFTEFFAQVLNERHGRERLAGHHFDQLQRAELPSPAVN